MLYSKSFYFDVRHCLNGTWEDLDRDRILEICQEGDTVHARVKSGPKLCGQESVAFTAELDGETLEGTLTGCAPDWCLKPKATEERVPRVYRDLPFEGTVSKKGTSITGHFGDVYFEKRYTTRGEAKTWCERRERKEKKMPPVLVTFERIEQFGRFTPRCGAPCAPPSESPSEAPGVTVPGIE